MTNEIIGVTEGKGDVYSHEMELKTKDITVDDFVYVGDVLCKITNIRLAKGKMLGTLKPMTTLKFPLMPDIEVRLADDKEIAEFLNVGPAPNRIHLGHLRGKPGVEVHVDVDKFLKHVSTIGTTGSGKTYTASVILEGLAGLQATGVIIDARRDFVTIADLFDNVEVIQLESLGTGDVRHDEIVKKGYIRIIDIKGYDDGSLNAYFHPLHERLLKIVQTLWQNCDPQKPVMLIVDEAHNYAPQSGIPKEDNKLKKLSRLLKTIASEGRGSGVGLIVITQRPAKISKDVISQCDFNVVLKIKESNDLTAVCQSVPGLSNTRADKNLLQNLEVGQALILGGNIKIPLIVQIKKRISMEKEKVRLIID